MIFTMTLTPNRATGPRRGIRLVLYRREGDRVTPYLYEEHGAEVSCEPVRWRDVRREWRSDYQSPHPADPEYAAAWRDHVRAQEAA